MSDELIIPSKLVAQWERQIATDYADLSEKEKESDRDQVRRYWPLITKLNAVLVAAETKINSQAEDDGLWFDTESAPEAYLQQELRALHEVIESAIAEVRNNQP